MSTGTTGWERLFRNIYSQGATVGDFISGTSPTVGGDFRISRSALPMLADLSPKEMVGLRRRMLEANQQGEPLLVTSDLLRDKRFANLPPFSRVANDLLFFLMKRSEHRAHTVTLMDTANPNDPRRLKLETLVCVVNYNTTDELNFMLNYLKERKFVDYHSAGGVYVARLLPLAYVYAEEQLKTESTAARAFVAMWFSPETQLAWQEGIQPAIEDAGYEAFRIDRYEHVNRIDDEILAQIRTSRFLVADFTSKPEKPRGGVYFEAGFSLGLDKPVIWTAHESMLSEIHFDTRQYNHIFWASPADLRTKLYNRVVAVLGIGPLKRV